MRRAAGSPHAWIALLAAAGALAMATASAAADPGVEQIHLTTGGQAAAKAVVLRRADFGALAAGWTGGATKPDPSATLSCPDYRPKQSDLVLIGIASTEWKAGGIDITTEADVLQTPQMVLLDWQRSVLAPKALPCLRSAIAKEIGGKLGGTLALVSFKQVPFPRLTTDARAYRAIVDVHSPSVTVPIIVDVILVEHGRTEITLSIGALLSAEPSVSTAEVRFARLLVSRSS